MSKHLLSWAAIGALSLSLMACVVPEEPQPEEPQPEEPQPEEPQPEEPQPEEPQPEEPQPEEPQPEEPQPEEPQPEEPQPEEPQPEEPQPEEPQPEEPQPEEPQPEEPQPEEPQVLGLVTELGLVHAGQAGASDFVTFGHVFAIGEVKAGETLMLKSEDGAWLTTQVDEKVRHPDQSLRHAIITAYAQLNNPQQKFKLYRVSKSVAVTDLASEPPQINLDFGISLSLSDGDYSATLNASNAKLKTKKVWLDGELVSEHIYTSPLVNDSRQEHAGLHARFYVRSYLSNLGQKKKTKVTALVENTYAYQPSPQDYRYDLRVSYNGKSIFSKTSVDHHHKTRWKKDFVLQGNDSIHVVFNKDYLMNTGALPLYDPEITVDDSLIRSHSSNYLKHSGLMQKGAIYNPMGTGGGRVDIGPLPGWTVSYILSQDKRAQSAMLGNASQAGSWPIHYRMKSTDQVVRIDQKPYVGLFGSKGDMTNRETGELEAFPNCVHCNSPLKADGAHQPSLAYVPYMLTGDYFYLEELQFWANYNLLHTNPWYRRKDEGIFRRRQVRDEAWGLRTLGQVAFITPDLNEHKQYFEAILANNLDYLYNVYVEREEEDRDGSKVVNRLGYLPAPLIDTFGVRTGEYALVYKNKTGTGVWQDDFHTWSIGYLRDLGFAKAQEVLVKRARFSVERMINPGYCWTLASLQNGLKLFDRNSTGLATLYGSFGEAFVKTTGIDLADTACDSEEFAVLAAEYSKVDGTSEPLTTGRMIGYAYSTEGFPSNLRLALAAAVDSSYPGSMRAWDQWRMQSMKPNYNKGPQMAVVPRSIFASDSRFIELAGKGYGAADPGIGVVVD